MQTITSVLHSAYFSVDPEKVASTTNQTRKVKSKPSKSLRSQLVMGPRRPSFSLEAPTKENAEETVQNNGSADLSTVADLSFTENNPMDNDTQLASTSFEDSYDNFHEEKSTSLADNLLDGVLRNSFKGSYREDNTFTKDIVEEIITNAYNGLSIGRFISTSDHDKDGNDALSSMSVVGTDESNENRDPDSIPEDVHINDDLHKASTFNKESITKSQEPEPDIEIFGTKLSDKLKEDNLKVKRENIMILSDYQPVDTQQSEIVENLMKLKKNKKINEHKIATKASKVRDACCGIRAAGGCNMF